MEKKADAQSALLYICCRKSISQHHTYRRFTLSAIGNDAGTELFLTFVYRFTLTK